MQEHKDKRKLLGQVRLEASKFDSPHILGQQPPSRKSYPVFESVVKRKREQAPKNVENLGGTTDIGNGYSCTITGKDRVPMHHTPPAESESSD